MINEPDIFDRSLQDLIRALRTELTKTDQTDAPTSKSGSAQPEDNGDFNVSIICLCQYLYRVSRPIYKKIIEVRLMTQYIDSDVTGKKIISSSCCLIIRI